MNNLERFNHTISVLVKAYFNNTLEHNNCYACAVGNIIAGVCGYSYKNLSIGQRTIKWSHIAGEDYHDRSAEYTWYEVLIGDQWEGTTDPITPEIKIQLDATGYTNDELIDIESAFERCMFSHKKDEHMFNGLMAVVDVLAEIHKIDLKTKEESKLLFVKA